MTAKLGVGGAGVRLGHHGEQERAREGRRRGDARGQAGGGGGGERRNFPVHLTLAQAALGLHKGGPLSSQLCWCP